VLVHNHSNISGDTGSLILFRISERWRSARCNARIALGKVAADEDSIALKRTHVDDDYRARRSSFHQFPLGKRLLEVAETRQEADLVNKLVQVASHVMSTPPVSRGMEICFRA
jgi:hypothetical protein